MHDKLNQSGFELPSFNTLHHAAELQPIIFEEEADEVYVPPPVLHILLLSFLSFA